jgi:iron complex transport system substrate-binding protein
MQGRLQWLVGLAMSLVLGASQAATISLRGDDGVLLTLDKPATRVVTLLPSLAEVVCDLGACQRLVGVDRYTNWPPQTAAVPVVGGGLDPQLEAIFRVKPDLIVMAPSSRVIARLRDLGLPVLALEPKRMADLKRTYSVIGQALGIATADQQFQALQNGLKGVRAAVVKEWLGKRVYVEVSDELYAAAPDSFVGETLTALGFENAIENGFGPFPKVNPEWVLRAQPDALIVAAGTQKGLASRPGWSGMRAVRAGRVCAMSQTEADALVRPGPRLIAGARWLVNCINEMPPPAGSE